MSTLTGEVSFSFSGEYSSLADPPIVTSFTALLTPTDGSLPTPPSNTPSEETPWSPPNQLDGNISDSSSGVFNRLEAYPIPSGFTGWISPSYADDYYNKIIITPLFIDAGNVISEQVYTIGIYNTFTSARTLLSLELTTLGSGIDFQGITLPYVFDSFEYKEFTLYIRTDGSSIINLDMVFNWDGTSEDFALPITGSRIVVIEPPFEAGMVETLEWKTSVITTNIGSEYRSRLRSAARQTLRCNYPMQPADDRETSIKLYKWLDRMWAVPNWAEAQYVGAIAQGASFVTIDTTLVDFRDRGTAYVYQEDGTRETLDIDYVTSSTVYLSTPTTKAYYGAYMMPARIGRVDGEVQRRTNGYVSDYAIQFDMMDWKDLGAGTAPAQFLGHDIYYDEVLMPDKTFTESISTRVDITDYQTGVYNFNGPWNNPKMYRPQRYVVQGLSDILTFKKWLHRRAGKHRPFWSPTFENDLQQRDEGLLLDFLKVEDNEYFALGADRSHIAIELNTGVWLPRTITSFIRDPDHEGWTILSLDSPLNIQAADIVCVSFLGLRRFNSDRVEIRWLSNRTIETAIPVAEILP